MQRGSSFEAASIECDCDCDFECVCVCVSVCVCACLSVLASVRCHLGLIIGLRVLVSMAGDKTNKLIYSLFRMSEIQPNRVAHRLSH